MQAVAATSNISQRSRANRDLSTWVPVYTGAVAVVGMGVVTLSLCRAQFHLSLLLFISTAAISELCGVELFIGARGNRLSVSSIITLASLLILGPVAGVTTHAVSGIVAAVAALRGHPAGSKRASWLHQAVLDAGVCVIGTAVAGWAYVSVGGVPGEVMRLTNVPPLMGAVAADALVSAALLTTARVLQTGRGPREISREHFRWGVPVAIVGGVLGAGALACAYEVLGVPGFMVFFLPVLSTGYSYQRYTGKMTKGYVDRLEEMNRSLREANLELFETLGAVIDACDLYTYGHSAQVAIYAGAIAEEMNLEEEEKATIVRAALVHDMGKVGIMDNIMGKQGALTEEEHGIMRSHPIIGAEIVGRMKGLRDLVPLVRYHHERLNGEGYPYGLKGDDIPLGARILALADSMDAMFSERPYRQPLAFKEVRDEVLRCSGTEFDPQVVAAFFAVAQERGRDFFRNSAATVDGAMLMAGVRDGGAGGRYLKKSMVAGLEQQSRKA